MVEMRSDEPGPRTMAVAPGERRKSARVPLDRPIRIGPPGGLPYATVSARDLSAGGLFIDAERSVRVGARFSVEVTLEGGDRVYVSEAEVVDNRRREDGGGFGVRFADLSDEARALLEAEVAQRAYVTLRSRPAEGDPTGFDLVETPTLDAGLGPLPPPEPVVDEEVLEQNRRMASVIPSGFAGAAPWTPTMRVRTRTRWSKMKAWLRSVPALSAVLYLAGAIALVVVGVAVLWDDPAARSLDARATRSTVSDEIYEQVVDGSSPAGIEPPAPPAGAVVNRLPDREPGTALPPPLEPTASPSSARAPGAAAAPASSSDRAPAESRAGAPARGAAPVGAPKPASIEEPAAAPAKPTPSDVRWRIPLGASARVRKQYVLSEPERYVVDVVGVDDAPTLPDGRGRVKRIRFGRHEGFVRLVIDAAAPLAGGEARVRNGSLELRLQYR